MGPFERWKEVLEKVPMLEADPVDVLIALLIQVEVDEEGVVKLGVHARIGHQRS